MNRNDRSHYQKGDFMKKQLTVALGLAVLATPAFATKARLQALGEDSYGSAYINDNRNIWLNAAQINNHKDLVTYEFGGNTTGDSAATPRGEGGVYKAMGNMVYGVHFGGASTTANGLRAGAGLTGANEDNNVDVFVGGDAGMKWGANLGYAKSSNETRTSGVSAESLRTRLGVIMGDTQVYGNINLINNAKGTNSAPSAKFEGKLGFQVGAIHAWEGNSLFVDFRKFDAEGTIGAPAVGKGDINSQQLAVGIGRVERLNDKTNLFLKAQYFMAKSENDNATAISAGSTTYAASCSTGANSFACDEAETSRIPVTVGLETEATSWLTLRGSVSQVVWGSNEINKNESTVANSTLVNAGATLKFGELSVDGVIGNDATGSAPAAQGTSSGSIRTDNLMTRVGMTYRF